MIQRKSLSYSESAIEGKSTKRTRLLTYANKINVQVINSKLYEILREVRVGSFIKLQHNSKDTIPQDVYVT